MLSCSYSLNSEKAESPVTPNISRTASASAAAVPSLSVSVDEKRMRREIANSNERRRMQSINAGFQSLRSLLPHHEGEKLSKVNTDMYFDFFLPKTPWGVSFKFDKVVLQIRNMISSYRREFLNFWYTVLIFWCR